MTATAGTVQVRVRVAVVLLGLVGSCAAQNFPTNGLAPFADDPQEQPQTQQQFEQFQPPQDDQYDQTAALGAQQDFLQRVADANREGQKALRRPQQQQQQFADQPQQLLAPVQLPTPLGFQPQANARAHQPIRSQSQPQQQPRPFQQPLRSQQQREPQLQSFQQPIRSQPLQQQQPQNFQQPIRSQPLPQPQTQSFQQPIRSQPPPQPQQQTFQQPIRSQPPPQPQPQSFQQPSKSQLQPTPQTHGFQKPQQLGPRTALRHPSQPQSPARAQQRQQFQPTKASPPPPPPVPAPAPFQPEPVRQQFFDQPEQTFEQPEPVPVPVPVAPRRPVLKPVSALEPQQREKIPENQFDEELFKQQAQNAKYSFSAAVTDSISDNQQVREEVRDGLNLKGLYSYSDGFFKRTVHYEADENGYRVINEEVEPLGDGPQGDPDGSAQVSSNIGGASLQYTVTKADIPVRHSEPPLAQTLGQAF